MADPALQRDRGAWGTFCMSLVYLSFWGQLGVLTRVYLDRLATLGCSTTSWGPCWVASTNPDGIYALYTAVLVSNIFGCFIIGLLSPASLMDLGNHNAAALPPDSSWQHNSLLLLGMRTGYCGCVTTFASFMVAEVVLGVTTNRYPDKLFGLFVGVLTSMASVAAGQSIAVCCHRYCHGQNFAFYPAAPVPDAQIAASAKTQQHVETTNLTQGADSNVCSTSPDFTPASASQREGALQDRMSAQQDVQCVSHQRQCANSCPDVLLVEQRGGFERQLSCCSSNRASALGQCKLGNDAEEKELVVAMEVIDDVGHRHRAEAGVVEKWTDNQLCEPSTQRSEVLAHKSTEDEVCRPNGMHALDVSAQPTKGNDSVQLHTCRHGGEHKQKPIGQSRDLPRWLKSATGQLCQNKTDVAHLVLCGCTAVLFLLLTILYDHAQQHRDLRMWFMSVAVSPPGCILRWQLSKLNSQGSGFRKHFPVGTFAANMLGTAISFGLQCIVQRKGSGLGYWGYVVVVGIQTGFCGSLTTVSTWVMEILVQLRLVRDGILLGYVYIVVTILVALLLGVIIYGWSVWA